MRILTLIFLTVTTVLGLVTGALAAFISSAVLQDDGLTAKNLFTISVASVVPLILTAALVVSHSEGNKDKVRRQAVLLVLSQSAGVVCALAASAVIGGFVQASTANAFWVNLWASVAVIISIIGSLAGALLIRLGIHYLLHRREVKERESYRANQENPDWVQKLDFEAWEREFKNEQHNGS